MEETPRINLDPTNNVRSIVDQEVDRLDDLRRTEARRFDEKISSVEKSLGTISLKDHFDEIIRLNDVKYQIQFNSAREAVGIASTAQEKLVAQALDGTKEAITKNDVNTDKRFSLLSEKIDGVVETISKSSGQTDLYVTQIDFNTALNKLSSEIGEALEPVLTFMNSQTGQQKGVDSSWTKLVTIISITATIITLLIKFAV